MKCWLSLPPLQNIVEDFMSEKRASTTWEIIMDSLPRFENRATCIEIDRPPKDLSKIYGSVKRISKEERWSLETENSIVFDNNTKLLFQDELGYRRLPDDHFPTLRYVFCHNFVARRTRIPPRKYHTSVPTPLKVPSGHGSNFVA